MATTDISLVNNVVEITPENSNARSFSNAVTTYAFNENDELQLITNGAIYIIALSDLRLNGSGSAPASVEAALTTLSSIFPASSIDTPNLSQVLAQDNDAGARKITSVADPEDDQDVATKAYVDANDGGSSYLVYTANIYQPTSAVTNISETLMENTIGTVTWSRQGVGHYRLSSSGLFTANKTFLPQFGSSDGNFGTGMPLFDYGGNVNFGFIIVDLTVSTSVIDFYVLAQDAGSSVPADLFNLIGPTQKLPIEIRVYP